jgi:hypothetical protein
MFAGMSLDRIEELARAAELEELVEQKRKLDLDNEARRQRGLETAGGGLRMLAINFAGEEWRLGGLIAQ